MRKVNHLETPSVGHVSSVAPSLPVYLVSSNGRVYSTSNWRGSGQREITPIPNGKGYLKVRLSLLGGLRINRAVHSLVALLYLQPRPSLAHEVRHLDGNSHHNSAENLAWGTRKDNADDRERHGRTSRGERHSAAIKAAALTERAQ